MVRINPHEAHQVIGHRIHKKMQCGLVELDLQADLDLPTNWIFSQTQSNHLQRNPTHVMYDVTPNHRSKTRVASYLILKRKRSDRREEDVSVDIENIRMADQRSRIEN